MHLDQAVCRRKMHIYALLCIIYYDADCQTKRHAGRIMLGLPPTTIRPAYYSMLQAPGEGATSVLDLRVDLRLGHGTAFSTPMLENLLVRAVVHQLLQGLLHQGTGQCLVL